MQSKLIFFVLGIIFWFFSILLYYFFGYNNIILTLWICSLVITGLFFFDRRLIKQNIFSKTDTFFILGLLILFYPLYLFAIYQIPHQMSTDEIVIIRVAREVTSQPGFHIFSLSSYFQYPSLVFLIFGYIAKALGGIDLLHMRTVHAMSGLIIIVLSYIFFRILRTDEDQSIEKQRLLSCIGAILIGSNHALIGISRFAMRENSPLLIELLTLSLLFLGILKHNKFFIYLGGVIVGFSFYIYLPARIIIALWFLFLISLLIFLKYDIKKIFNAFIISIFAAILVTFPLIITTINSPIGNEFSYVKEHLLIFSKAREEQRKWVNADTVYEGLKTNFIQGITAFNNKVQDNNYVYINYGYGFVDFFTGILIWVGFIGLILKTNKKEADFLILGSFLLIFLTLSIFFDKNPHYNRLLIQLPFISFLVIEGVRLILKLKLPVQKFRVNFYIGLGVIVLIIFTLNMFIFRSYILKGITNGDDVGGTARYVESRKNIPNYSFFLLASNSYPYFNWGEPEGWIERIRTFTGDNQKSEFIPRDNFSYEVLSRPFTIFMTRSLSVEIKDEMSFLYPDLLIHNIKPDGSLVAIEVK